MAAKSKTAEEIPMQTTVDMSKLDGVDGSDFGVTLTELRELMEFRGPEAAQLITTEYGGVSSLCQKLLTNEHEGNYEKLWSLSPDVE